ncbi:MAG: YbaN family protein [Pseudomonadales bacterium]|nr:YbaN family protein [Halieaceae bacterium]MCP5164136.1 YbaN family protein [Pseudomonadales bacterium]MCP5190486.1 YbaN family protein [Pseudomonadales bacterium]MCP5203788.1 YbaN family protein [Pseudomonadales bacterium]
MRRSVYKPLGFLFLALGLAGAVLPILPSTPFVLLAAWFFARSSPRWHAWLLASELFGPMIRNWENNRCLSCRTKVVALVSMLVAGGASVVLALEDNRLRIATGLLMLLGCSTILLLKTCRPETDPTDA